MMVRKAVIPTAGFGTRFLPVTRSVPKNMLPVWDRPSIHLTVEEAVRAGIEHVILVLAHGQEAISHYFDRLTELEQALESKGSVEMLRQMVEISRMVEISCVYQKRQLGPGHAVLTARAIVGNDPFAVLFPDDLIFSAAPTIARMVDLFIERRSPVIAVSEAPDETIPAKGIVDARQVEDRVLEIVGLVEKPALEDAPSNLGIVGRYVLPPEVFDALDSTRPSAGGEIWLTDAIASLLPTGKAYAYRFPGVHFDVGTPEGLLRASVHVALQQEDRAPGLREWLRQQIDR